MTLVASAAVQVAAVTPGHALGLPVVIDDFRGTTFGTRTVSPLPPPDASTTAPGTFRQNGDGTATMTMNGNGNGVGGVQLDYTSATAVDFTAGNSNTQFFIDFHSIERLPVQTVGETALNLSVQVSDDAGHGGTLNTGISNVFAFSPALPFSSFSGTPKPNFNKIKSVSIQLRYPRNFDTVASLTVVMGLARATPTGGSPPAVPATTVSLVPPVNTCPAASTPVHFRVGFTSAGQPEAVTFHPPDTSDIGLRAQDVQISGTATGTLTAAVMGGPSTYDVAVSGMTNNGSVTIHIPAAVVSDAWGQSNTASANDPVASAPVFITANAATFTAGTAGSLPVTTCGRPTPTLTLKSGALPTGVNFTAGSLVGTPGTGTGATYPLVFEASNSVGTVDQSFTLTVNEPASIASPNHTTFAVGTAGTFTVTAHGSPVPTLNRSGSLPAGVSFTDNGNGTATLAGTPGTGAGGSYPLTFTAHNGVGSDASQSFTLAVNETPSITSADSATFTAGTASTLTITTGHAFPTPTLTRTGALPDGVTFTDNGDGTATLTGTPAGGTGGTYALSFTAANGVAPDATQSFTLTVNEAPSITSAAATTFVVGAAGTFTVAAGHEFPTPPTFTRTGALPDGVAFTDKGNGTATLTGTPTAGTGGAYPLMFTAHNGILPDAVQNFTLTVDEPATITSADRATFIVGTASTFTITTGHAFPTPTLTRTGAVPDGVTFTDNGDGTATLTGTPGGGTGGTYAITITAANGAGSDATQRFTLTVDEAPSITSVASTAFTVGAAGTFTVTASGFPAPTLSESGALPSGVTFDAPTGALSGTPDAETGGLYTVTFTATNGIGTDASQTFTLSVDQASAITSAAGTAFTVGSEGTFTLTVTGFPTPSLSEAGALPSGVQFDTATGVLSGTPDVGTGGVYAVTFTATNGVGADAVQPLVLTVDEAPAITSASAATLTVGSAGNFTLKASGFPAPTLSESGALPSGVTFDAPTGRLSGAPDAGTGGTYAITFNATNGVGADASQDFTLTIDEAPVITSTAATGFTVGAAGSFTVTATGFPVPALSESGALASGVHFDAPTGELSGTPDAGTGGTYAITFTATNGVGADAVQPFVLTVGESPVITSDASTTFTVGASGSFTVTAAGAPTPTLSMSGPLPSGVTFDVATGVLSGPPGAGTGGTYPLTFTAANGVAPDATQVFTLNVDEAPTITSDASTAFTEGRAGSFTATAVGFPPPTLSESGALPNGVHFAGSSGVLSGTPAAGTAGNYPVTLTAHNGVGADAVQSFTLTVNRGAHGYYVVSADGTVFAFHAPPLGSLGGRHLNSPIVGIAVNTASHGFYLVAADGGVFAFHAPYLGSLGRRHLNSPIVGMAVNASSRGYYLVAADGGVFAFHAPYLGSLGRRHLNSPIVGMAVNASSRGYYLVAADGGVFAFHAPYLGSLGRRHLNSPIVGMAVNASSRGYYLVAADGGVFAFHTQFFGSLGPRRLNSPIVGMIVNPATGGYALVARDGGVFAFHTPFMGSVGRHPRSRIIGIAVAG